MWQAPSHRVRALASAKKRARERQRKAIHLKLVDGEIRILGNHLGDGSKGAAIRVILNDLGSKGLGIFSSSPFMVGQEISITLEKPKRFFVKGRIAWCQEHDANSHVISNNPFSYRMGIVFTFADADEERKVREYCEILSKEYLYGVPAYAAPHDEKVAA